MVAFALCLETDSNMKSPSQTQVDHADADFDTCKVRTAHDSPADLALANITPKTGNDYMQSLNEANVRCSAHVCV